MRYICMENITKNINALQKTPGQILKTARKNGNISIDEVSQALLLSKSIINALEADDYSNIVAKVYAEGYLKAYAGFLQLPVITVLESFGRLNIYNESKIKPIKMTRNNAETADNSKNISKLFLLLKNKKYIMLIVILASLFCLILIFIANKHALIKTSQDIVLATNNTKATTVFPITINNDSVSTVEASQSEVPKNDQKATKNKNKPKSKPKLELLDENSENLIDDAIN